MLLFSEVLSYAIDNYVDPVDTEKLMRGSQDGLMGALDAHGAYLSQDDVEAWKRGLSSTDVADPGRHHLDSVVEEVGDEHLAADVHVDADQVDGR